MSLFLVQLYLNNVEISLFLIPNFIMWPNPAK